MAGVENEPHVAMHIAEQAVRQVQAALPRSRGGIVSSLLCTALGIDWRSRSGDVYPSTPRAFSSDASAAILSSTREPAWKWRKKDGRRLRSIGCESATLAFEARAGIVFMLRK
jgi:hypothetical protein